MESAIRTVCEPIFNKPLKEISFGTVLLRLFEISRRFNVSIQPQLILLQKTLLNIEGLGRDLYPDLDIFKTAGPIMRDWVREKMSGARPARERARAAAGDPHQPADARAAGALGRATRAGRPPAARGRGAGDQRVAQRDQAHQPAARQGHDRGGALLGGIVWMALGTRSAWAGWAMGAGARPGSVRNAAGDRTLRKSGLGPIPCSRIRSNYKLRHCTHWSSVSRHGAARRARNRADSSRSSPRSWPWLLGPVRVRRLGLRHGRRSPTSCPGWPRISRLTALGFLPRASRCGCAPWRRTTVAAGAVAAADCDRPAGPAALCTVAGTRTSTSSRSRPCPIVGRE